MLLCLSIKQTFDRKSRKFQRLYKIARNFLIKSERSLFVFRHAYKKRHAPNG